jgi:hypothetical protein
MWAKFNTINIKLKYVFGLAAATILGGALTATVLASIPDSSGIIHGCYQSTLGTLRVIDSNAGATCRAAETVLNWNQTGPQGPQGPQGPTGPSGAVAYGHIRADGSIDTANSLNIASLTRFTAQQTGFVSEDCITVNSALHTGVTSGVRNNSLSVFLTSSGDSNPDQNAKCPAGTNVVITNWDAAEAINTAYYITFN